jgi:hypothetical protein
MRSIIITTALLAIAAPAIAEDAAGPLTASAAKSAGYIKLNGGKTAPVDHVVAGPSNSVAAVVVIYEDAFHSIPGSTVTALDHRTLQTSLGPKDVAKLP